MLQQLESVCESLYKSQDHQQRQQSEQARDTLGAVLAFSTRRPRYG